MTKSISYSPAIDSHIYDVKSGCKTKKDWCDLAIAALDQAGFSQEEQDEVEDLILRLASVSNN